MGQAGTPRRAAGGRERGHAVRPRVVDEGRRDTAAGAVAAPRGDWSIDDPIVRWLPGAPRSPVTIADCLLHTAGLIPSRQYYRTYADPAELRRAVIAELAGAVPGKLVSYSDVGFMLLGWAAEECAGEPLAELFAREVAGPLDMTSTGYLPRADQTRIAATEQYRDQRLVPGLICGAVHDGNAFALGGVSGHAGLFGTAGDLARYAAAWLRPQRHPVLARTPSGS